MRIFEIGKKKLYANLRPCYEFNVHAKGRKIMLFF